MESMRADLSSNLEEEEEEEEKEDLVLKRYDSEDDHYAGDFCLVGHFLIDQTIIFNATRNKMTEILKPVKGVSIKSLGDGRYMFGFYHLLDVSRVLKGSPWSFNNDPLLLHHLQKGEYALHVPLSILPLWIKVYDIPHRFITERFGTQVGNYVGKFLEYDNSNRLGAWRTYMRVCVGLDVTQLLKRFKNIRQPNGISFKITFKYEKFSTFCFVCGRLGNSENLCALRDKSSEKPDEDGGALKKETVTPGVRNADWPDAKDGTRELILANRVSDSLLTYSGAADVVCMGSTHHSNPIYKDNTCSCLIEHDDPKLNEAKKRKHEKLILNQESVCSTETEQGVTNEHFLEAGPVSGACPK
ncbi:hypothetical protein ACS0TY_026531 [Phlomoides rotata]